jgi:hypothetical protein
MSVSERSTRARKRNARKDFAIAVAIVAGGIAMPGVFLMQLAQGQSESAQVTQTAPVVPAGKQDGPAEAKPGGTRPTTPAPEPAQPDAEAQKAGAQPALPPAPAEKTAPPIREK